jgi:hypothetical protein
MHVLGYRESSPKKKLRFVRREHFAQEAKKLARTPYSTHAVYTDSGPSAFHNTNFDRALLTLGDSILKFEYDSVPIGEFFKAIENKRVEALNFLVKRMISREIYDHCLDFLNSLEREVRSMLKGFEGYRAVALAVRAHNPESRNSNLANYTHTDPRIKRRNTLYLTRTVVGGSTVYTEDGKEYAPANGMLCAHAGDGASHRSVSHIESDRQVRLTIVLGLASDFVTNRL